MSPAPHFGVLIGVPEDNKSDARGFSSNKLAVLRKHPFFFDLDPEALDQLCRYAKHATLKRAPRCSPRATPATACTRS